MVGGLDLVLCMKTGAWCQGREGWAQLALQPRFRVQLLQGGWGPAFEGRVGPALQGGWGQLCREGGGQLLKGG